MYISVGLFTFLGCVTTLFNFKAYVASSKVERC